MCLFSGQHVFQNSVTVTRTVTRKKYVLSLGNIRMANLDDEVKYIQTYKHTNIHTYIHTYAHACINMHAYIHAYIHTYMHACIHTYIHTYLLLISMLWHRQAIFKSKGDKLSSCAECRIWTRGLRHQIASRLNTRWQTDWAIEDQAKNLNSTARPYDQRAFSPPDPTASWLSHLALAIYIFVAYIDTYIHT